MKYAFLAAIISGFSIYINKFAVAAMPSPILFTALKNLLVGLVFLFLVKKFVLSKKLILVSLLGGALPFYLFFTGLSQIPAVNGAILQKTLIIWVALLAIPLLKEKLTFTNLIAVGLLFFGNIFVGGFNGFKFSNGELMVLASAILWSAETVIIKKINLEPNLVAVFRMLGGSLILLPFAPVSQIVNFSSSQWLWILATSAILFAYVSLWLRALKNLPAITVTSILVLSTLVTNLLSTKLDFGQSALMTLGVLLLLAPYYSNNLIAKFRLLLKS